MDGPRPGRRASCGHARRDHRRCAAGGGLYGGRAGGFECGAGGQRGPGERALGIRGAGAWPRRPGPERGGTGLGRFGVMRERWELRGRRLLPGRPPSWPAYVVSERNGRWGTAIVIPARLASTPAGTPPARCRVRAPGTARSGRLYRRPRPWPGVRGERAERPVGHPSRSPAPPGLTPSRSGTPRCRALAPGTARPVASTPTASAMPICSCSASGTAGGARLPWSPLPSARCVPGAIPWVR